MSDVKEQVFYAALRYQELHKQIKKLQKEIGPGRDKDKIKWSKAQHARSRKFEELIRNHHKLGHYILSLILELNPSQMV